MKSRLFLSSRLLRKILLFALLNGIGFMVVKTTPPAKAQDQAMSEADKPDKPPKSPEKPQQVAEVLKFFRECT